MRRYFSHSGDLGDIIYSLPTIRAAGGGSIYIFPWPGRTAHGMDQGKVDRLKPLLERQEYIDEVEYRDSATDSPLNGFRHHAKHGNLADCHLATAGLDWRHRVKRWLNNIEPVETLPVIATRTSRYRSHLFPWKEAVERYSGKIGFVGFKSEYVDFCNENGQVPYVEANDFYQLAQVIEGSKLFIGNATAATAVSEGLKHNMLVEVCPSYHTPCVFQRMGCVLCWDGKIEWPDV